MKAQSAHLEFCLFQQLYKFYHFHHTVLVALETCGGYTHEHVTAVLAAIGRANGRSELSTMDVNRSVELFHVVDLATT